MRTRQQVQYKHDLRNHFDILSLSRADRLKHYGLHFAKYAGRLARGDREDKSKKETLVDAFLVSLSAANALNQDLSDVECSPPAATETLTNWVFTDYAGRFADACEKIDHLEEFRSIALDANAALVRWVMGSAVALSLDLDALAERRRQQIATRAFYVSAS